MQLAGRLGREHSISIVQSGEGFLTGDFPVFIPAHGRSRFGIHLGYPYSEKFDGRASEDARYDFGTKLAKYIATDLANLDGHVCEIGFAQVTSPFRLDFSRGSTAALGRLPT